MKPEKDCTKEYIMAPNTTIYEGDYLIEHKSGHVRPATARELDPDGTLIPLKQKLIGFDLTMKLMGYAREHRLADGKGHIKVAAEYKKTKKRVGKIRAYYEIPIFRVQADTCETENSIKIGSHVDTPHNEPVTVIFREHKYTEED
jgi:hypothetical protein